jgi:hypothetical protein
MRKDESKERRQGEEGYGRTEARKAGRVRKGKEG